MAEEFDELIPVAFSIHNSKGVYALLLGSGISRPASIPTGHELTSELIKRIALTKGVEQPNEPHSWYTQTFGAQPRYDELLLKLAPSADDRHMLLRPFFEPSDEDRSNGYKRPTHAHKAIARLAKKGYFRVIITTNFDRLLEQALESEGIVPCVIYSDNMVSGMLPLVHAGVTIIKVNGDYTDTRLRNSEDELTSYGPAMTKLLSQVFDEYGLIACGWSAKWDRGLRDLIQGCASRRFTSYWTAVGVSDSEQMELVRSRQGQTLAIGDADSFFQSIEEKVLALESLANRNPLSSKTAAESVKLYLPDPSQSIRLQDLVLEEARRVRDLLGDYNLSVAKKSGGSDELLLRVKFYEDTVDSLMQMLITGARYGGPEYRSLWRKAFELVGASLLTKGPSGIMVRSLTLQLYPLAYLFYGFGIASLLGERGHNLFEVLRRWKFELNVGQPRTPHSLSNATFCQRDGTGLIEEWPKAPNGRTYHMPFSEFLVSRLKVPLENVASSEQNLVQAFDQLELLLDLDARYTGVSVTVLGRFIYKIAQSEDTGFLSSLQAELSQDSGSHLLLAGFFGGSQSKFEEQLQISKEIISQYRSYYF